VFAIVRELSLDELRDAALRVPRVAVIAPTTVEARETAVLVFGNDAPKYIVAQDADAPWPSDADVVLVDRRTRLARSRNLGPVVEFSPGEPVDVIRNAVIRVGDDMELALGRTFPALRQAAALYVVNQTSRVNGQFALVSNIPAMIPLVGGVLAAGADTIVLTKNQLMMIFKLAAIHGRDVHDRFRIYREMLPVVGAGLFWRTVAREMAAMVPFAAGTVPKVAIAVAGTYAAGMAAHVYYLEGKRASADRMRGYYRQALDELAKRPAFLRGQHADALPDRNTTIVVEADYRADSSAGMP
jgi:uncharacterized protein (DUF697 family)